MPKPYPEAFITDNGIRTVVYQDPTMEYQSFKVGVDTSELDDGENVSHSHFLEHVLVRDRQQFDGQSFSQVVSETANRSYAATYPEVVEFTLDSVPDDAPELITTLLTTLARPVISDESVAEECVIIASEMSERGSNADTGTYERGLKNHAFTHTAEDEAAVLEEVTPASLRDFHERFFTTSKIFVVTAGPMSIAALTRRIEEAPFAEDEVLTGGIGTRDFAPAASRVVTGHETKHTTKLLQLFNVPAGQRHVGQVMDNITHNQRDGSFWSRAVAGIGVYSAHIFPCAYPYEDNSRYLLRTEGEPDQLHAVHDLALETLEGYAADPPGVQLVEHARKVIKNDEIMRRGRNDPMSKVHQMSGDLPTFPHITTREEHLDLLDTVTPEDIQAHAARLLSAERSYSITGSAANIERVQEYLED